MLALSLEVKGADVDSTDNTDWPFWGILKWEGAEGTL